MNGSTGEADERIRGAKGHTVSHGAELLLAALASEARLREHSTNELAAAIGIHPAHWYRLRAHPA